jgi:VanZ family protein
VAREPLYGRHVLRQWRRGIVLATAAAYFCLALLPFAWEWPIVDNHAVWRANVVAFPAPGLARSTHPPQWTADALASHTVRVSLAVLPYREQQSGPARIFTSSYGPYLRNITIGQEGRDLVLRVRADERDDNGMPEYRFADIFKANRWHRIDLTIEPGRMLFAVEGRTLLNARLSRTPLTRFHPGYFVALGNEVTANRPWLGEIARATVTTPHWSVEYVDREKILLPQPARRFHVQPKLRPFSVWNPSDWAVNLIAFVPFGCVVGATSSGARERRFVHALMAGFALSLVIELCQFGLPGRFPSVDDLILNTLGSVLGFAAAVALQRRLSAVAGRKSLISE